MTRTPTTALIAAVLAAWMAPAAAQTAVPAPGSTGLDRARSCEAERGAREREWADHMQRSAEHQAQQHRLEQDLQAHATAQARLDLNDVAAVRTSNEELASLNARVAQSNQHADALTAQATRFHAERAAFKKRCAGLALRPLDAESRRKAQPGGGVSPGRAPRPQAATPSSTSRRVE